MEKIEGLLKIADTPEISLLLRYNGIQDQLTMDIYGGDVSFDTLHRILELASKAIRKEEVKVATQQQEKTE